MKNIVFDIGNVLVKWDPHAVVKKKFKNVYPSTLEELTKAIFKSEVWKELNRGNLTEKEAIDIYHSTLNIKQEQIKELMEDVKESLLPLEGGFELLGDLYKAGIPLYCITDNVKEIIKFLRERYDFFIYFRGVIVSAECGLLKPSAGIYRRLLEAYSLLPEETVFFDDLLANVEGAKIAKMHSIQFTNAEACRAHLKELGFQFERETLPPWQTH